MAKVLVRNLSETTVTKLKARARRNKRSLQSELEILIERDAARDTGDFRGVTAKIRAALAGRKHSDSAALVRSERRR